MMLKNIMLGTLFGSLLSICTVICAVGLSSCVAVGTPSPTSYAYKTLSAANIAYDSGMQMVADLDKQGKLPEETKQEVIRAAKLYKQAYDVAVEALIVGNEQDTAQKINGFLTVYQEFVDLVRATLQDKEAPNE